MRLPDFLYFTFFILTTTLQLSIKSTHTAIVLLCVDVEGFILNVVVPFLKFPMYISGFKDLSDTGFKDQGIANSCDLFCLKDVFKFYTPVGKMTYYRKGILFLSPFLKILILPICSTWKTLIFSLC